MRRPAFLDIPPDAPAVEVRRIQLRDVQRLICAGGCVTALSLARRLGVQFNPETLEAWRKLDGGPKRTYAWLVRSGVASGNGA